MFECIYIICVILTAAHNALQCIEHSRPYILFSLSAPLALDVGYETASCRVALVYNLQVVLLYQLLERAGGKVPTLARCIPRAPMVAVLTCIVARGIVKCYNQRAVRNDKLRQLLDGAMYVGCFAYAVPRNHNIVGARMNVEQSATLFNLQLKTLVGIFASRCIIFYAVCYLTRIANGACKVALLAAHFKEYTTFAPALTLYYLHLLFAPTVV